MDGSQKWFGCAICGAVIKPGSMLVVAAPDQSEGDVQPSAFDEEHWPPSSGQWRKLYEGKAEAAPPELSPS